MASILKTGSLEKAGWQRRRDARRVSFAGKVKNVIVTLPSVPKADSAGGGKAARLL